MDRLSHPLLSVVIPVRDEDPAVLRGLLEELRTLNFPSYLREVIVVDDGSKQPSPHATVRHATPRGYGAALKTGIRHATSEFIATLDGDGQHHFWDLVRLFEFFVYFQPLDMVVGDRRLKDHGVRLWGRKGLNWVASCFSGRWIPDLNSGMRIFRRELVVGYFPILSDHFSFTTSLTLSLMADGYRVDYLPIKVHPRTVGKTKVRVVQDGLRTFWLIVRIGGALRTRRLRAWMRPVTQWVRHAG